MLTPNTILDNFERLGWVKNDPMSQTLQLRRENPAALAELVMAALDGGVQSSTFIDAALDLMDDTSFDKVAAKAWQMSKDGVRHDVLSDVLDTAALQSPQIFAGDWDRLLNMTHREPRLHLEDAVWRALDSATVHDWRHQLEGGKIDGEAGRATAVALLNSRQPDAVLCAWKWMFPEESGVALGWLMSAGYALEHGALRALHSESPFHIDFGQKSREAIFRTHPQWKREIWANHPTWQAGGATRLRGDFGGVLSGRCGLCHEPLHHLLTLQQPVTVGIASQTSITFGTCLSCLGWESDGPMFYRHDDVGVPSPHPCQLRDVAATPQFPTVALQEAEVGLFVAPARWNWQDWGASNDRQNLSRVGGPPSWVQSADHPECPDCGCHMSFVMQLDSNLPQVNGDEWLWGSGGVNYTFWCQKCRTSAHLCQWT